MSSKTLSLLIGLGLAAPLAAQEPPTTAEEALAQYNSMTSVARSTNCDRSAAPDEIVVCGRDESDRLRLPLRSARGPRDGPRLPTGETPSGRAEPLRGNSCGLSVTDTLCGGLVGVVGVSSDGRPTEMPLALKLLTKLLDPSAEVSPPPRLPTD